MNQPNSNHFNTVGSASPNYCDQRIYGSSANNQSNTNGFNSNYSQTVNLTPNNPEIWSNPTSPFSKMNSQANQFQNIQNQQFNQINANVNRPVRSHDSICDNSSKQAVPGQNLSLQTSDNRSQARHFSLMNKNKQLFCPIRSKNSKIKRSQRIKCIAALEQYKSYCKDQIRINFIISGIQSPFIYPVDQAMTLQHPQCSINGQNANFVHTNHQNINYQSNQNQSMNSHNKNYEHIFQQQLGQINCNQTIQTVQPSAVINQQTNQINTQRGSNQDLGFIDTPSRHRGSHHQDPLYRKSAAESAQFAQIQQNSNTMPNNIGPSQFQCCAINNMNYTVAATIPDNNSQNREDINSIQNYSQLYHCQQNLDINSSNGWANGISHLDINTYFIWFCLSFPKQFSYFNKILVNKLKLFSTSVFCPSLFPHNNNFSNIFQNLLSSHINSASYFQTIDLGYSQQFDSTLKSNEVIQDFASLFSYLLNLYEQALSYKSKGLGNESMKEELIQIIKFKLAKLPLLRPGLQQILKAILVQFYHYASFYTYPCPYFIQSSLLYNQSARSIYNLQIPSQIQMEILKCNKSHHNRPIIEQKSYFMNRAAQQPWQLFLNKNELPNCGEFEIYPPLSKLQLMNRSEIQQVQGVQIWNIFGMIQFLEPISLYNKHLASTIVIKQDIIQIYDFSFKIIKNRRTFFNYGRYQKLNEEGQSKLVNQIKAWIHVQGMKLIRFDIKYGDLVVQC